MAANDLFDLTALEQARLVRSREVSSEELVRGYLERISRLNPSLHAFTQVLSRSALKDARRKDAELSRRGADTKSLPPFYGVPIAVKDLNFVKGSFTRLGSRAYRWFLSPVDDKTVTRLREGGFVILGKTATSELGAMPVTEPDIHAPTRNPWDLSRTPGGSSGGAGSALAAGLTPIAQGSDGAGSIRIPSSFGHLFGIKPSRGRVPDPYGRPDRTSIATVGPMAHSVSDAAALLDVMAGLCTGIGAPHWAPAPSCPFHETVSGPPPRALKIRFTLRSPLVTAHPEVAEAVGRVTALLEQMGHHVEEGAPPVGELEEFLPVWQFLVAQPPVLRAGSLQPVTAWLRESGKRLRAADVLVRQGELEQRVLGWFGDADLWVTPAVAVPPPAIGAWRSLGPADAFGQAAKLGAFTALFNITGQPAASIPAGVSSEGWPIGVQLAGRPSEDGTVLAVARALEEAMPWHHRQSPLRTGSGVSRAAS